LFLILCSVSLGLCKLTSPSISFNMFKVVHLVIALGCVTAAIGYDNSTIDEAHIASQVLSSPSKYDFPILQSNSSKDSGQFPMPQCHGITLEEATIDQLQDYMVNGNITSVQIAMCYMQRILQTDEYTK
jgi:amidase